MSAKVTKTSNMEVLTKRLAELGKAQVLVGIPAANASRPGEEINNAELLFILTNGSPINNIPATPIVEPAIQLPANAKMLSASLAVATKAILDGNAAATNVALERTGDLAANCIKRYFTEGNDWPPNAPSTIARKGSDQRNINLGELRRSISYVVEPVGSLPQDQWKKSELGPAGKFGGETPVPKPPEARKVVTGTLEEAETLGGAAELLIP